jgi:hypothetical protein
MQMDITKVTGGFQEKFCITSEKQVNFTNMAHPSYLLDTRGLFPRGKVAGV